MHRIARYEIREVIADTGTGQVCIAFDPVIHRQVVVKTLDGRLLPAEDADEMIARFRREATAAGRLTHPGIVTIYEYGEEGALHYIAMEHARGPTLRQFLANRPQPLATVVGVARQLFAALIYAHEQGVLHRDLKPSNIVLAETAEGEGGPWRAKILDFGIAKVAAGADLTQAGRIAGTPGYMAPEQYRGAPTDARVDVYAVGVTLFEMLAGRRTFAGEFAEVLEQVLAQDAPRLGQFRPGLPAGLEDVIAKALARDARERYAGMREFREAFVRTLASPVVAAPSPAPAVTPAGPGWARPPAPVSSMGWAATDPSSQATLPLRDPPSVPGTPRPRLLLVDDEERILGALGALFRLRYEVLTATDGHVALDLVRKHQPEVIVSDQRMPAMAGVDFLRQAREIDPTSVRILLTGYSDLAAIVGSINDGEVFRFVNKPWSNQEMKEIVAQAVEVARTTRATAAALPARVAPEPVAPHERFAEAIVVAQPGRELFDAVTRLYGRQRPVCHAANVAAALQIVEDEDVAAIVCDVASVPGADVMLKMLKRSHPRVQGIVVADAADASHLVSLINEAQILRFLNKPPPAGLLERALRAALSVHANVQAAPALAARQAVKVRAEVAESSLGRQILQRLSQFVRPPVLALRR